MPDARKMRIAENACSRLFRAGMFCVLLLSLLVQPIASVMGSQEFYMETGETMVIPCLSELWSDQDFCCVIGNPDVLMTDGSGRAVIALREGRSDVHIHMTNPDIDIEYTFIVSEPRVPCDEPAETSEYAVHPEAAEPDYAAGNNADQNYERTSRDENSGAEHPGAEEAEPAPGEIHRAGDAEEEKNHPGTGENEAAGTAVDVNGSGAESTLTAAGMSVEDQSQTMPGDTDQESCEPALVVPSASPVPDEPGRPYWENMAEGGIRFEAVASGSEKGVVFTDDGAIYKACVRVFSDGEVRPILVCAGGREIRWKYLRGFIYADQSEMTGGTIRGAVLDSYGKMYFFSC